MNALCRPLAIVLLAAMLSACGTREGDPAGAARPLTAGEVLAGNATVRFVPIEGGCWALETASGRYEPIALPAAYRTDGQVVYVVLHAAPAVLTTCMIAPLVAIDSIRTP